MNNSASTLDTQLEVLTPENIAFEYRVAGPFKRLPAYLVDLVCRWGIVGLVSLVGLIVFGLVGLSSIGLLIALLSWFVIGWFYGGLFETYWNGQTPGKRMMGLRVLSTSGQPISGLQAVLRNVLRAVDAAPLIPFTFFDSQVEIPLPSYVVGLLAVAATARFQRLGDLAAGTIVVIEEKGAIGKIVDIDEPEVHALAEQLPAGLVVSRPVAKAIARYVERRQNFGPLRRAEISAHLGTVLLEQYDLPADTDHDLLLCALYERIFHSPRASEEEDEEIPLEQLAAAV